MNVSEVAGKRVEYCPAYYAFPMSRPFEKKKKKKRETGKYAASFAFLFVMRVLCLHRNNVREEKQEKNGCCRKMNKKHGKNSRHSRNSYAIDVVAANEDGHFANICFRY